VFPRAIAVIDYRELHVGLGYTILRSNNRRL